MDRKPEQMQIGFIGTGVMGSSMVRNLIKNGYRVAVYTRTKKKAEPLLAEGAAWKDSVADIAQADVIMTMVGYPQDVEEVYFGDGGLIRHARQGTYMIDFTTSSPKLAVKIAEAAEKKGISALDAPVSGGDTGAQNGTLSIMVGGEETAFQKCMPFFQAVGKNIVYQGHAGAGQHTKMSNQITIAANMVGVCEAIIYAERAGLNPERVLQSITSGAAGSWSLSNLAPRMLKGDFAPGFYVKHFIKDMKIAIDSADELGLKLPGLELARTLYERLAQMGEENSGTQALYKWYRKTSGKK